MTFLQRITSEVLEKTLEAPYPQSACPYCGCPAEVHNLRKNRKRILAFIGRTPVRRTVSNVVLTCMECAYQKGTHQVVCFTHPTFRAPEPETDG